MMLWNAFIGGFLMHTAFEAAVEGRLVWALISVAFGMLNLFCALALRFRGRLS